MAWLELDDRILEHPKFIRAVKLAGSDAIHLWLGIKAYCGQQLTDGFVPADMLDEVRGPTDRRKRAVALKALIEVGLLERRDDGSISMHDYLDWSSSRENVLDRREKARERKAKSRDPSRRDTQRDFARTDSDVTPVVTNPSTTTPTSTLSPSKPSTTTSGGSSGLAERANTCPVDLLDQLLAAKEHERVARDIGVSPARVRLSLESFCLFWLTGKGRTQVPKGGETTPQEWCAKAVQWALGQHRDGRLPEEPPPGLLEHEQRRKAEADHSRAEGNALARGDIAEYERLVSLRKAG